MRIDKKFERSTELWNLQQEHVESLFAYFVYGFDPGSFFTALLENNMYEAACHSHPANRWEDIRNTCRWIVNSAPRNSYGSQKKVEAWMNQTDDERRKCCEDANILMSAWDMLKEPN